MTIKEFLVFLKHRLGFHTKDCPIPCLNKEEKYYTCKYTYMNFKKNDK